MCACCCMGSPHLLPAVGILTMDHYVVYISIIRCLVGNEFVFEADIVAVPNPNDRQWINEHIKPYRPGMYIYIQYIRVNVCMYVCADIEFVV